MPEFPMTRLKIDASNLLIVVVWKLEAS